MLKKSSLNPVSILKINKTKNIKKISQKLKLLSLFSSAIPGIYCHVPLPSSGTRDQKILEISKVLMPLYQNLGKFTETTESIAACAVDVVVMHNPTNFPVKGFDMNTCPEWNQIDLPGLQNRMAIANHFLKPEGILLCVCHASFGGTIATYANETNFREDHAIGIFTKGIHGVVSEVSISSNCSSLSLRY